MVILRIIFESFVQAIGSLRANKLRTILSLLGITIGIFCIIAVKSAVDSLQTSIVDGFSELGSNVIYIDKRPWNEDPGQNEWKYLKRPEPNIKDWESIKRRSNLAENSAFTVFTGGETIKYANNTVSNAFIMGTTYEYEKIQDVKFEYGRYFSQIEYENASNRVILGSKVAEELFQKTNPVGQTVKLFGQPYQVVGVLQAEGENMFNFINFDLVIWVGYKNIKKFVNTQDDAPIGRMLNVKAKPNVDLADLKSEIAGILRANRKLKPFDGDNFSINELSMLSQVLESIFGVINSAGLLIGIFSLIVGMFSVSNIMFVSVKERTSIIGIKKALGAKRYMILLEFLIESIILCLIGGLFGLFFVFIMLAAVSLVIPFAMALTTANAILGVGSSVVVGILSGIIPAWLAAKMDPVEAIRS